MRHFCALLCKAQVRWKASNGAPGICLGALEAGRNGMTAISLKEGLYIVASDMCHLRSLQNLRVKEKGENTNGWIR